MIKTDGRPTIAWAGASVKDRNSKRRWIARKREAKRARIRAALARH